MTSHHQIPVLTWSDASKADTSDLQNFVCTDPATREFVLGRKTHPRPWEFEAQAAIRGLKVRRPPGQHLLLGRMGATLAVVLSYEVDLDPPDNLTVFTAVLGVAQHLRGRGHAIAALDEMTRRLAVEYSTEFVVIRAHVDPRNQQSQNVLDRIGLAKTGERCDPYDIWEGVVALPPQ